MKLSNTRRDQARRMEARARYSVEEGYNLWKSVLLLAIFLTCIVIAILRGGQ